MIRPVDPRYESGSNPADGWECGVVTERAHRLLQERPRIHESVECDEIRTIGEHDAEGSRISLASRLARIESEGFERIHRHDPLLARGQRARVLKTAHRLGPEVGRLFVDEEHQANEPAASAVAAGEQTGKLEHGRHAGRIVVGAGAARY